jgi:murein DD-endopeptidase MepM/ murein hydrolase activator NlpD
MAVSKSSHNGNHHAPAASHAEKPAAARSDDAVVKRGELIGHAGNTGTSYGAHLHFELRDPNGKAVDPLPFFEPEGR